MGIDFQGGREEDGKKKIFHPIETPAFRILGAALDGVSRNSENGRCRAFKRLETQGLGHVPRSGILGKVAGLLSLEAQVWEYCSRRESTCTRNLQ